VGYEACFLSGLAKLELPDATTASSIKVSAGEAGLLNRPHRPFKIIYATLYYDVRPAFVVDITEQFEARLESIYAYKSQFTDQEAGRNDFPAHAEIRERVASMARFYGMLGGVKYAEPFLQKEVGLVDDLMKIPMKSI
jgi:N-acetylglucosamine malate deacetylase 1